MSDFRVQGKIALDGAGFFSTLNRARGSLNSFGNVLAGAFSVGAIAAFSKSILDLAGNLNDVSEALNLNVEFLQRFKNSAAKSGGGLDDIGKFLFESQKARQSAVDNPKGKEASAFKTLGFSQSDISKLNPQQFIEKIIKAFADGATPQEINAVGEIGGRAAKKLIGGFKEGLDMQTEIINESLISQLDEIGDKFTEVGTTMKSLFAPALGIVADGIKYFLDKLEQVQSFWGDFLGNVMAGISDGSGKSFSQMQQEAAAARDATAKEQEERAKRVSDIRSAARSAKRSEQQASPDFEPIEVKAKTAASGSGSLYSDSRLSVGGFLGQGAGSMATIAQKQLEIQTQSLNFLKSIDANLGDKGSVIV